MFSRVVTLQCATVHNALHRTLIGTCIRIFLFASSVRKTLTSQLYRPSVYCSCCKHNNKLPVWVWELHFLFLIDPKQPRRPNFLHMFIIFYAINFQIKVTDPKILDCKCKKFSYQTPLWRNQWENLRAHTWGWWEPVFRLTLCLALLADC